MTNEFGHMNSKGDWDEYIGKYVIIHPGMQSRSMAGKLISVHSGIATLNPFQGGNFDPDKGQIREIISQNAKLTVSPGTIIEPTTKKNLENYCEHMNKQEQQFLSQRDSQNFHPPIESP